MIEWDERFGRRDPGKGGCGEDVAFEGAGRWWGSVDYKGGGCNGTLECKQMSVVGRMKFECGNHTTSQFQLPGNEKSSHESKALLTDSSFSVMKLHETKVRDG